MAEQVSSEQRMFAMECEMDMLTDMFSRLSESCYKKCIPSHYADGMLNKGESVCIDRCVAKYMLVHDSVGKKMQKVQQEVSFICSTELLLI